MTVYIINFEGDGGRRFRVEEGREKRLEKGGTMVGKRK